VILLIVNLLSLEAVFCVRLRQKADRCGRAVKVRAKCADFRHE
jgi:hypothetical protein